MSETPVKKRQRVTFNNDDEIEVIDLNEPTNRPLPPTLAGKSTVAKAVESHPEPFQELAIVTATKFNALKSRQRQQEQTKARLALTTFTPRSARLNFQLTASECVTETPEFLTLATAVTTATAAWTATVKDAICKVAELESKNTTKEIVDLFLTTFKRVAHLVLLQEDPETDLDATLFAALILDHYGLTLCKYIGITKAEAMPKLLHPTILDDDTFTVEFAQEVAHLGKELNSLMKIIFVDSWTAQLTAYKKQAAERAVSKQAREYLDGGATLQAAALMDAEPTADPALLKDVIKKQVDQETRQLRAELNKLKQAQARSLKASNTPAKKPTRGATPQKGKRAPSTNKSNRSPRKPTSPHGRKRNDASAERPGNASPTGKRKPKNNNSSNQSKKKGKKPQRSNASNSRK